MKKVKNFARFYAILKNLPGDPDEIKPQVVGSFTGGRTTSLREMTPYEYNNMCDTLEHGTLDKMSEAEFKSEIKRQRSAALKRMQKLGIDTTDWAAIDNFCLDGRIAGKVFRALTVEELKALIPKLESILRKNDAISPRNRRMEPEVIDDMDSLLPPPERVDYHYNTLAALLRRAADRRPS